VRQILSGSAQGHRGGNSSTSRLSVATQTQESAGVTHNTCASPVFLPCRSFPPVEAFPCPSCLTSPCLSFRTYTSSSTLSVRTAAGGSATDRCAGSQERLRSTESAKVTVQKQRRDRSNRERWYVEYASKAYGVENECWVW